MFKNNKNELDEDKVREIIADELNEALEYYIGVDEAKELINNAVEERKDDFEDKWRATHNIQEKIMREINGNIGNIVSRKLEEIVAEQVKMIEDKLLVELARQAMSLEEK